MPHNKIADHVLVSPTVVVGTGPLSREEVVAVARDAVPGGLSAEAEQGIAASRAVVEALADDAEPHYGISTGFGALATRHIPASAGCSCSAAWSARTRPAPGPRSSARWSGR